MILDKRTEFCDNVALNTGAPGNYVLGDSIDTGAAGLNQGSGSDVYLVITVDQVATSGGAATAAFNLVTDDNSALSSPTILLSSQAFPLAQLVAGRVLYAVQLPNSLNYERYLGVSQTTGTAAFTGGRISAFLTAEPTAWRAYADAVN
jgi:hypothetical protein